jgi:DNA-binding NarL/FixJ family response regulator
MRPILIADKQDMTKIGLTFLLSQMKGAGKVTEVVDKKDLLQQLGRVPDAVVILDYTSFDFTGPEDLLNVTYRFKESHWILFSDELSTNFLSHLLCNSSHLSVLFKDSSQEEINTAFSLVLKNERFICNRASNQLIVNQNQSIEKTDRSLTHSEKEILKLMALGKTTKEIAQERFSSIHTIMTHRKNIFRKLEVNSLHDATKYALRAGIVDAAEYYI